MTKEQLDLLRDIAIDKWGDRGWLITLSEKVGSGRGLAEVRPNDSTYTALGLVFRRGGCNLKTFVEIVDALDHEIEIVPKS